MLDFSKIAETGQQIGQAFTQVVELLTEISTKLDTLIEQGKPCEDCEEDAESSNT